jgi:hypothetical protein
MRRLMTRVVQSETRCGEVASEVDHAGLELPRRIGTNQIMWRMVGLLSGIIIGWIAFRRNRKPKPHDLGSISEQWLAEQRATRDHPR